jgi:hypothetical protein
MSDASQVKISQMLQEGLEAYGAGDFPRAFLAWGEVLELDPGNEEALDYLRDADRRAKPRGGVLDGGSRTLVDDARTLLRAEGPEASLELLMSAGSAASLECDAMIELLRASMFSRYRKELGDLSQIPRLIEGAETELRNRNLPASAGFLLSMIDGETPLSDLVSVSGMDRFEAMRALRRMFGAGILEWVK